mmetsp:Transcript_30787/g.75065  ORF Transcript_30787/g.75065 Transcript_30787/m.75065 type:complete len:172 (-) Transcript_30787:287-802(-)|eukprot:CAMPEP_0114516154 /NCGR_PEP_ID=MMETSP0109-20121206/17172_1 /TAXON_ID=29199 /ORGANISM="Chlorarachnion reptans, Strain CCCM449" /LENGTH=171 /DNA_ID=CAMNT_0001696515 /DNA_START=69 /DNA_END=584 /DNA_ORIENTATION=+
MSDGPEMKVEQEKGSFKQQALAIANQFVETIDKKCADLPYLKDSEAKFGAKPAYIVLGAAGLLSLIVVMIIGFNAIVNIVCFSYPAYASLKAMQSKEEDYGQQWLTYFMIFGLFSVAESFYPALLTDVTFYVLFKLLVLVWCFLPMSNGAKKIYDLAIVRIVNMIAPPKEE